MNNEAGGVKEYYYSNGGMINLDTNKISPEGGLEAKYAKDMSMQANLLPTMSLGEAAKMETSANTGGDPMTSLHMPTGWSVYVAAKSKCTCPRRI